jgi:hypothetical protein
MLGDIAVGVREFPRNLDLDRPRQCAAQLELNCDGSACAQEIRRAEMANFDIDVGGVRRARRAESDSENSGEPQSDEESNAMALTPLRHGGGV